jgi:hypothetical protein
MIAVITTMRTRGRLGVALLSALAVAGGPILNPPTAGADNKRLNDGVVANVYTIHHQAGCPNGVAINPQLQLAAQQHAVDVLNNRSLDGDAGSDGSMPQDRANTAGFHGKVAETVAINPALAINGIDVLHQWYYNPAYFGIMSNCDNTAIGVWSENGIDRSVVVAVYGQPENSQRAPSKAEGSGKAYIDPTPDYDASDELEFGINWLPWILRGVYPPPAYPPS